MLPGNAGKTNRQDPFGRNQTLDQQAKFRSTVLLRTLGQLSGSMARVKGRKSVLLFSEDFALASDAQVELRNTIQAAQRANVAFYSIDARGSEFSRRRESGFAGACGYTGSLSFPRSSSGSWLGAFTRRLLPGAELLNPALPRYGLQLSCKPRAEARVAVARVAEAGGGGGQGGGGQDKRRRTDRRNPGGGTQGGHRPGALEIQGSGITPEDVTQMMSPEAAASRISLAIKTGSNSFSNRP